MRLNLATDVASTGQFGDIVLGVDTHKNTHTAAVLSEHGVLVASSSFPTTAEGYARLLDWARGFGDLRRAGVEGTGSYGAGLARHLLQADIEVIEVNQPDRASRRRRGKSDVLDAESAARAVLGGYATAHAKSGDGPAEMLRLFKLAKDSAVKSRTQAINQLKAVIVNAPVELRDSLAGLSTHRLVQRCSGLRPGHEHHLEAATKHTLRLLARRVAHLDQEVADLTARIHDAIAARHSALLARYGAGPDTAATLLITVGDNPERMRSEASFAALCGASPVEASSGKTTRKRLSRGGDRRANSALYRIALSRMRWDPETKAYIHRRISEGKTRREAIRCLKRYIARELYPLLAATTTPCPTTTPT